jgi:hypothetical protein
MCLILLLRQVVVRKSSISYYRRFFLNADYCNITSSRLLVEEAEEEEGGRGSYMCKKSLTKSLGFLNFQICSFLVKISSSLA